MRSLVRLETLMLIAVSMLLGGCAAGNRYAYDNITVDTSFRGSGGTVAVGTHDRRSYVLDGKKEPQFVGLQRGGYGNTFDVRTGGGMPLADDMTRSVVNTLNQRGFSANPAYS